MKKMTFLFLSLCLTTAAFAESVSISCGTQLSSAQRRELVTIKKAAGQNGLKSSKVFEEDKIFYLEIFQDVLVKRAPKESNASFWDRQSTEREKIKGQIEKVIQGQGEIECGISG